MISVTYTVFRDVTPTEKIIRADVPWPEFVRKVKEAKPRRSKEALPLISLSEFGDVPSAAGCIRHSANVLRVYGVELDHDAETMEIEEVAGRLQQANIEAVIHASASNGVVGEKSHGGPRWRVLAPLSEPALPQSRAEFVGRLNRVLNGAASSESFSLSQSFYFGAVEGVEYQVLETHGRFIDEASDIAPLPYAGRSNGARNPHVDRSAGLFGLVCKDLRAGKDAAYIHANYADHPHVVDQKDPHRTIERCIENGRKAIAADTAGSTQQPDASEWEPPTVISYGASFDPAKIPLRQWLIRGRYARGEGTAFVGPPGCNKSSLLLTDALQLTTGQNLLGDIIDQTGGVLLLAGEDRRRDLEARIAALCVRYQIAPAQMRDQLHVVYQSSLDPAKFTLAAMVKDIALLNTNMIDWLRLYPGLVALFVDPMASWHRLLENDVGAMGMLCQALRGIAEQANIAVGFDHHVNKANMGDPEAHVHNLASIRGSSAIAADMRWAFTLARLKSETAMQFAIPEEERRLYRRLDSLKANYGPDEDIPRLLKVETVQIANTEHVGVLTTVDADRLRVAGAELRESAQKQWQQNLAGALGRMLLHSSPRSGTDAASWIASNEPTLFVNRKGEPLTARTVYAKLETVVGAGLPFKHSGGAKSIVARISGTGPGRRFEIDFDTGVTE